MKKKSKRSVRTEVGDDVPLKRRRKERARKAVDEQEPGDVGSSPKEGNGKEVLDTELPATPSADLPETGAASPIIVEEADVSTQRAEPSSRRATYAPDWEKIFPDTMLNSPILRAEWVSRSLPPAELAGFVRAKPSQICDIANWSAILVSFFFLKESSLC